MYYDGNWHRDSVIARVKYDNAHKSFAISRHETKNDKFFAKDESFYTRILLHLYLALATPVSRHILAKIDQIIYLSTTQNQVKLLGSSFITNITRIIVLFYPINTVNSEL